MITLVLEGGRLPTTPIYFMSPDFIHDQNYHRLSSLQNQTFLLCRWETKASGVMAVRLLLFLRRQQRARQSSPSISASDEDDALYPNFLNHNCYSVLLATSSHQFNVSQWEIKLYWLMVCSTVCVFWPRSRCATFQVSGRQQITSIPVTS